MDKTPAIQYSYSIDMLEEARARIAHEINEQGEEAFNLALSEYGYVKVEEARDIELLRRRAVFEREGRIKALEQLCRDMWSKGQQGFEITEKLDEYRDRMTALGLLEGGEK